VLTWLDHDETTYDERGLETLLDVVRRLLEALRSRA
jgi:hypothetical protein